MRRFYGGTPTKNEFQSQWNFVDITQLRGSSRGFAAFLPNTFLRVTSGYIAIMITTDVIPLLFLDTTVLRRLHRC